MKHTWLLFEFCYHFCLQNSYSKYKMEITKGFYDLCVPFCKDKVNLINIVKELIELGYKTIAIDQLYDHSQKNPQKRSNDVFPVPENIDFLEEFRNKVKILQRITIHFSDVAITHSMTNSNNLKKFNIIAIQPKNEAALNHCCSTINCDIISFDPDESKVLINRKSYQIAVSRGIWFEIKYANIITNSTNRKHMIKFAHNYHAKGQSKNIIFTSSAKNVFELRGPYDVCNLSLIFGLSEEQGKNSISSSCRSLIIKAESRRIGKTVMLIKNHGPMIFSSSSSEDDFDDSQDEQSTNDEDESNEQPHKKKKLC